MTELNKIALKIISDGKGILAADESNGTMTKRLADVNVESTPKNRLLFIITPYPDFLHIIHIYIRGYIHIISKATQNDYNLMP